MFQIAHQQPAVVEGCLAGNGGGGRCFQPGVSNCGGGDLIEDRVRLTGW